MGITECLCLSSRAIQHVRDIVLPKRNLKICSTVAHPDKLPFIVTRHVSLTFMSMRFLSHLLVLH